MFVNGRGFTLVELLVSMSIIGIVVTLVVPSAQEILISFRGATANNTVRHSLKFARTEAITRNQVVRVCASNDGVRCSGSKKWEDGWIVYLDYSGKSSRTDSDPVIRYQPALKDLVIRKNGREKTVKFNQAGWIGLNRSFSICARKNLQPISRIVLIHSGRLRTDTKNIRCS